MCYSIIELQPEFAHCEVAVVSVDLASGDEPLAEMKEMINNCSIGILVITHTGHSVCVRVYTE